MLREKGTLQKANKKTEASMELLSFEASGLLVFLGNRFVKVYKITRKDKLSLFEESDENINYKFFYISAEGGTYLNYLTLTVYAPGYVEAKEIFKAFESKHSLEPMGFDDVMNRILDVRDKDYSFSYINFIRKKLDLVEYLEKDESAEANCNFVEIRLDVYPSGCQSKILNLLKKMELPYILAVEKEAIGEEDKESIKRQLKDINGRDISILDDYAFGRISLMLFSLDEETLDIASKTVIDRLTEEGFIACSGKKGEKESYRYMTSLGLIGKESNVVLCNSTLRAFM